MKKLLISMVIAIILNGCAASNKAHWQKTRPKGGWAGRNYIGPVVKDSINIVRK